MIALQIFAWLIALAWLTRTIAAVRGVPRIPNLLLPQFDVAPASDAPRIAVIVPARNEQRDIAATLQSLLAQDYPNLTIVAIDDRSTDSTGSIITALAAAHPSKLRSVNIRELPPGWLGKTHAMATAATLALSEFAPGYLLFTDADVLFRPDALRRALACAAITGADHLVLFPTHIIRRWDEPVILGLFQLLGIYATRPWRRTKSPSHRDAIGIGAFNLLTVSAYQRIGGFESMRMEIVEDIALARRVLKLGLTQRAVFGRDLIRLHWAAGILGIVNVMTKNIFCVFRYNPALLLMGATGLVILCAAPFATIFIRVLTLPSVIAILSIAAGYIVIAPRSGLSAWNALFAPFAAILLAFAELRSMYFTLRQRGVIWRGTFYPLAQLRRKR